MPLRSVRDARRVYAGPRDLEESGFLGDHLDGVPQPERGCTGRRRRHDRALEAMRRIRAHHDRRRLRLRAPERVGHLHRRNDRYVPLLLGRSTRKPPIETTRSNHFGHEVTAASKTATAFFDAIGRRDRAAARKLFLDASQCPALLAAKGKSGAADLAKCQSSFSGPKMSVAMDEALPTAMRYFGRYLQPQPAKK